MPEFFSLLEAAAKFAAFEKNLKLAEEAILIEWAVTVRDRAKQAIGTYKFGWDELAASTQADRERRGYPADEPLLLTGKLRDSIQASVDAGRGIARVGSNEDVAVWMEMGTRSIPPRSFLAAAASKSRNDLEKIAKKYIHAAWTSAKHDNSLLHLLHAIKLVLEVAHHVYKELEKHTKEEKR